MMRRLPRAGTDRFMETSSTTPPQTPGDRQVFLDHVGWFVPSIEQAGVAFERLGFTLTLFVAQHNADPQGGPPKPAGTGNRCAMLGRGYLELLCAVPGLETPLSQQLTRATRRYGGIHLIALTVGDAVRAHARLREAGFEPEEPVHLRRPVETRDGAEAEVSFTVLRVPPGKMPEGRVQMLTQNTPALVWQDHLIARDNAVSALTGVLLCVADPTEAATRYARFAGKSATGDRHYMTIDLDRGRLGFATRRRAQELLPGLVIPSLPFMAAVGLASADIDATRAFMAARDVVLLDEGADWLCIDPSEAAGGALMIRARGDAWPPAA
jgi:hypothetical protein